MDNKHENKCYDGAMPFTRDTAKEAGRKGGTATKDRRGTQFFAKNGRKGMTMRWGSRKKTVDK